MNGIISMSATLLEDTNLNEDQKEIVEIVVRSGEILMGIVNNVLDFSKIEAGIYRSINYFLHLFFLIRQG